MSRLRFAIGSTNPVKVGATTNVIRQVFPGASLVGVDAHSGVDTQPHSDEETRLGALNRARIALSVKHVDYGVGLESGVIETEFGLLTCAWCVITRKDGVIGVGGGAHMLLPESVARLVRQGKELGSAMDEISGMLDTKHQMGALGLLTDGLVDRRTAFEDIVRLALGPFVAENYYRS